MGAEQSAPKGFTQLGLSSQSGKRFHRMGAEQSERPKVSHNTGCTVRVATVSQDRAEQSECQKVSHNRV